MKSRLIKLIPALVLSLAMSCVALTAVRALGLGVGPSDVTIESASPGRSYFQTIFVYNTSNTDQVYSLSGSGDIASWVTFHAMADNQTITELPVSANGRSYANVEFSIPANALPKVYQGQLLVTGTPSTEAGAGAHVQIQLPILVHIQMVGAPNVTSDAPATTFVPSIISGELNLMSLTYEGKPAGGQLTKISADLKNLTGAATTAHLEAEVYLGDKLIDTIKSDELSVGPGADVTLTTYYKPQQAGDYTIKAQIFYNGKLTPQKTIELKVGGSSGMADQSGGLPLMAVIGGVAGLLVIAGVAVVLTRRSRR